MFRCCKFGGLNGHGSRFNRGSPIGLRLFRENVQQVIGCEKPKVYCIETERNLVQSAAGSMKLYSEKTVTTKKCWGFVM